MSYRFASLTSGLLARKGAAQPAMASHAGGNPRALRESVSFVTVQPEGDPAFQPNAALAKAGYTYEQGPPPFPAARPPVVPPVVPPSAQPQPARQAAVPPAAQPAAKSAPAPAPAPVQKAPLVMARPAAASSAGCSMMASCGSEAADADPAKRFHVSVRLKQSHFVRLKIASAQLRKPSQDIVGEALNAYFQRLDPTVFGDCACSRG